jgi:hypothetical protein
VNYQKAIEQLENCNFKDEIGHPLENNTGFIHLKGYESMIFKNVIGVVLEKNKPKYWFQLDWGDAHGNLFVIPTWEKIKRIGGINSTIQNWFKIDPNDYYVTIENITFEKRKELGID